MKTVRILVVDDLPAVRRGLVDMLALLSHNFQLDLQVVGQAGDGLQAIKLAEEFQPDVILMDLEMPGLDGLEATRRIKAAHPGVRILILTIHNGSVLVSRARQYGADAFLVKGCGYEALLNAILQKDGPDFSAWKGLEE